MLTSDSPVINKARLSHGGVAGAVRLLDVHVEFRNGANSAVRDSSSVVVTDSLSYCVRRLCIKRNFGQR